MADIEVMIDDNDEKDRSKIESEALGCIDALIQSRIAFQGALESQLDPAEDVPGEKPRISEHQINPEITIASLYV